MSNVNWFYFQTNLLKFFHIQKKQRKKFAFIVIFNVTYNSTNPTVELKFHLQTKQTAKRLLLKILFSLNCANNNKTNENLLYAHTRIHRSLYIDLLSNSWLVRFEPSNSELLSLSLQSKHSTLSHTKIFICICICCNISPCNIQLMYTNSPLPLQFTLHYKINMLLYKMLKIKFYIYIYMYKILNPSIIRRRGSPVLSLYPFGQSLCLFCLLINFLIHHSACARFQTSPLIASNIAPFIYLPVLHVLNTPVSPIRLSISVYLSGFISLGQSMHTSVCPAVHLMCPFNYLSVHSSIYLFICPTIRLFLQNFVFVVHLSALRFFFIWPNFRIWTIFPCQYCQQCSAS